MTDRTQRTDAAAVQFMIVDFLEDILRFSESPSEMGLFLARKLREVLGVRAVVMLQHGPDLQDGASRILALDPERAGGINLLPGLNKVLSAGSEHSNAAIFLRPLASPTIAAAMDLLGVKSLSLTALRVGDLRVGTLIALDHLDLQRTDDVLNLLAALSPVFALILRNALHFEAQEGKVIAQAEEYRALLRTNLDGYLVTDSNGSLLDANEAYLRMSGYDLAELRGLHMSILDAVETKDETVQHTEKMKLEGSDRFLSRHRRKDGTSFPVEVSTTYVPSRGVLIGFIRDLTEKAEAEHSLRESEAHHRELIEILGEGVAATDLHETIIMANPEAARIFAVPPDQLIGQTLRAFMDEADWQQVMDQTRRRMDGQTNSYQTHIRRADGTRRTLQLTATPRRDGAGRVTGSLAVFRDMTEEIQTQEALRLSQKMESLGNLAGGLAHDMNNVLGAILGLATTNLDLQPEGSRLHSTFQTITKACLRGRNMVKSLLDFARKDMTGERSVSLNELVQEEARLLERTIPTNVSIRLDLDPEVGTILGDPDALSLVLMNLCVNAVDAMPEGGLLTLSTRSQPDGRVLLAVVDTGAGMSPETLEHAVDPFFTTKPQGKGTGLGLSLAYSTVKAHHGDLTIQSRLGQGTSVEMRFQAVLAQAEPAPREDDEATHPGASCRILLVDDDELIQSSVAAQLEAMGHEAIVTSSGEQAMERVEQGLQPDAIILDMNMPGWGGARTLPRLRAALPEVPILLSTGRADQRALDLARAIQGVTILAKPFSFRELQATFAAILPKR